jgi:hypothetical protein
VTDETRTRFLAAIAAQIPIERIAEVHLFHAIRQGGMESGVAVIAVERALEPAVHEPAESEVLESARVESDAAESAGAESESPETDDAEGDDAESDALERAPRAAQRYTVYSARYRHTLKGPDRGKWEVTVTEEADAPLLTVDAVVRGVQRRSGDADEIVRLSGDEVRAVLPVAAAS